MSRMTRAHEVSAPAAAGLGGVSAALRPALLLGFLGGALAYGALSLMAPRYVAEAMLSVQPRGSAAGVGLSVDALQKQARAVVAPELAARVANELKLAGNVEFNRALGYPDTWSRLLALTGSPPSAGSEADEVRSAVQRHADVAVAEGRLAVRFRAVDAELAANGANALAQAYVRSLAAAALPAPSANPAAHPATAPAAVLPNAAPVTSAVEAAATVNDAAAQRVKELNARATQLAAEVAAYETELARLAALVAQRPKVAPASDPRVADLTSELSRAKAARADADVAVKNARDALKSGSVEQIADLQLSPSTQVLLQERARLEHQITELSATLLPEHPRMQQLNTKLAGFKREIAAAVAKTVDKLEREAKAAAVREDVARKSLEEAVVQPVAASSPNEVKMHQVESALKDRRAALDQVKADLNVVEHDQAAAATAAVAATKAAEAAPAGVAAAVPSAAAANTGANLAEAGAIEAAIVKPAVAAGLVALPDRKRLTLIAATLASVLGLLVGLAQSSSSGRRTGPAMSTADAAEVLAEREAAVVTAARPSATRAPSAIAALAAALTARLGLRHRQLPSSNAASAEAVHDEMPVSSAADMIVDPSALEGEAHASAARLDEIAGIILARPAQAIGIRTLVTGCSDDVDAAGEALGLARRLASGGKGVVLVDWCTEGNGLAAVFGLHATPGINELLLGRAGFEDVVQCLAEIDGSQLHAIAAGGDLSGDTEALDPDVVNLVLDALDEAYDHIVVVGRHDEARELFEAILGRFDVGVVVHAADTPELPEPGTFLGFEVTEIETLSCVRPQIDDAAPDADGPVPRQLAMQIPPKPAAPAAMTPASPPPASTSATAATLPFAALAKVAGRKSKVEEKPAPVSQAAIARALRSTGGRGVQSASA